MALSGYLIFAAVVILTHATGCATRSLGSKGASNDSSAEKRTEQPDVLDCSEHGWTVKPVTAFIAPKVEGGFSQFSDLLVDRYIAFNTHFPQTTGAMTLYMMDFLARDPKLNFLAGYRAFPTEKQVVKVGEAMTQQHLSNGVARPWEKSNDEVVSQLANSATPPIDLNEMKKVTTSGMRRIGIVVVRSALEDLDTLFKNSFAMPLKPIEKVGIYNTHIDTLLAAEGGGAVTAARCQVARVLGKLVKSFSESKEVKELNTFWYRILRDGIKNVVPPDMLRGRRRSEYFTQEVWPQFELLCEKGFESENGDLELCQKVWETTKPFAELLHFHGVP
jgi:hypothetical protein